MFQSNGHKMFLSDDDVPSAKHPCFFNRLGLVMVFNLSVRRTAEAKQIYMFYRNGFSLRAKRNLND